jgi:hypothetical protein
MGRALDKMPGQGSTVGRAEGLELGKGLCAGLGQAGKAQRTVPEQARPGALGKWRCLQLADQNML